MHTRRAVSSFALMVTLFSSVAVGCGGGNSVLSRDDPVQTAPAEGTGNPVATAADTTDSPAVSAPFGVTLALPPGWAAAVEGGERLEYEGRGGCHLSIERSADVVAVDWVETLAADLLASGAPELLAVAEPAFLTVGGVEGASLGLAASDGSLRGSLISVTPWPGTALTFLAEGPAEEWEQCAVDVETILSTVVFSER